MTGPSTMMPGRPVGAVPVTELQAEDHLWEEEVTYPWCNLLTRDKAKSCACSYAGCRFRVPLSLPAASSAWT